MAKLTREQFNKFNEKCKNGFMLDVNFFCIWNEKRCTKNMKFEGEDFLYEVIIEFHDKSENYVKIGSVPTLVINKCVPTGTCNMYSIHNIYREEIGELVKRKSVKILQELTGNYTDEKVFSMIQELIAA